MRKTPFVLAALLTVAGICVMLWPVVTGYRLQANTDEAVQSFLEERKPEQQYPELLAALQEYNRQLYKEKQCNLTDLEACEEPAADLTAYGIEDEIIGVLEIPAMELTMPVKGCQDLVRFFALRRIKPHTPLLVRAPVNSFEFQPCGRTPLNVVTGNKGCARCGT